MPDAPRSALALARRVRYSVANEGLARVAMQTLHRITNFRPERSRGFDRVHGTDTAGRIDPALLGYDDAEHREHAIVYAPSPPKVTRWMLDHAGVHPEDTTFVDLGCGKGRVLLVAAERPFRRVLGVDLSATLAVIARTNVDRWRGRRRSPDIEVVVGDATEFPVPDGDLLVHLYHPFQPPVLALVLDHLSAARAAGPARRVTVAYLLYTGAVDEVRATFARTSWLREVRYEASLWGEYDWLIYTG